MNARDLNLSARFTPITPQSKDYEYPVIEIGGVFVFVYIRDHALRVSLHLDDAEPPLLPNTGNVPLEINVGREIVYALDRRGHEHSGPLPETTDPNE